MKSNLKQRSTKSENETNQSQRKVRTNQLLFLCFMIVCFLSIKTFSQSAVTIKIDTENPGREIPDNFCGLSYEIKLVLPDSATGVHYFRPSNKALIKGFKTLGIKHLRVGGNTADRPTVKIPNTTDIDSLFAFAKAAGVKVMYTVRMKAGDPVDGARIAKYIMDNYKELVFCITIGNEPNMFFKEYSAYLEEWKKFATIIKVSSPDVVFNGPSNTPGGQAWAGSFAKDLAGSEFSVVITQHDYPGRSPARIKDAEAARELMLSRDIHKKYMEFGNVFVPAVLSSGLTYRMTEVNSFYNGGMVGASDNFTSALWVLDYLYWWALYDAAGINFHTGEKVMPGTPGPAKPNVYTALSSSANGFKFFPIAYGMKAFTIGSKGKIIPTSISTNKDSINVAAYSVKAADGKYFVTIINKEYGEKGREADVVIEGLLLNKSEIMFLSAPNGEITTIEGVSFGGSQIENDGSWKGTWKMIEGNSVINIPSATAVIIKISDD